MSTGLDDQHDLLAAQDSADGVHAAGDGLSKSNHVRLNACPLRAEHAAGSANTGLDLVTDEEDVVLLADGVDLCEVVIVGNNNTSLALDGLYDEGGGILAMGLQNLLQVGHVVVADGLASGRRGGANVGDIRAIVVLGLGVGGQSDGGHLWRASVHVFGKTDGRRNTYSSAVEVLSSAKDQCLALLNALDLVSPLAGNLDGSLRGLGTGVHGQHHVVAEDAADLFGPLGENIVVEGS